VSRTKDASQNAGNIQSLISTAFKGGTGDEEYRHLAHFASQLVSTSAWSVQSGPLCHINTRFWACLH